LLGGLVKKEMMIMTKFTLIKSVLFAALLALSLPVLAAAQGTYDPWGRNRNDDYRRDRNGRYGRYDDRYLRDSIQRLDRLAKDFERELDRDLDHSREDGSRHEDRVNNEARDFRNAVGDLKSRFGNGRDLNRSMNEAQRVLQQANRTERVASHHFDNGRLASDWSEIRQELRVIADAYGLSYYDNGRYGRNDDIYGRRRDDTIYRRNPNNNNVPWWRRIHGYPY
jgi:hypothetical protein